MKKKFLLFITTFVILCSCILPAFAADSKPTTEVLHYEQKINPRSDYSLDVEYNLKLKVISTDKDITWIKIPIQNSSVDEFKTISDNIDEVRYYEEDGKSYIRVNLKKLFSEGDIIEIKFSIRQSDVHTINNDIIYYSYIIDGFSDINKNELLVLWNSKKVLESSSNDINSDSYYTWNTELLSDKKFNIFIKYDSNQFEELFEKQDSEENNIEEEENDNNNKNTIEINVLIFVLVCLFCVVLGAGLMYLLLWMNDEIL